jgi:3-isopropylmalate/(R)-2-methylmalate dehydratase small subunit
VIERFAEPVTTRYVVLPYDDVDTDQIIPAGFLMTGARANLGRFVFHNWRFTPAGEPRAELSFDVPVKDARLLVAGHNFGCGSSREHAVWSLLDAGFRAVVSTSFGDIFRANALSNGLLPIELDGAVIRRLIDDPAWREATITIDVPGQRVALPDASWHTFPLPPFRKHCLIAGLDELDYLLSIEAQRASYETSRGLSAGLN